MQSPARVRKTRIFLAILLLAASASSCSFNYDKEAPVDATVPDAVFEDFSRETVSGDGTVFRAKAEKAEYFSDEGKFVVTKLSFEDLDDATGAVSSSGEADKAVYYESSGDAEFTGFVSLHSVEENASFETDYLKYSGATQTLEGGPDRTVLVRVGEKLFLRGMGFYADVREKLFSFRDGVDGTIWNK